VQAIILAGGEGTRLRPLTLARPKPIVPLLNVPFLHYQIGFLSRHGITDIVLACSHLPDAVQKVMGDGSGLGIRLRYAVEETPLGTGGGVRNAADLVNGRFVVLNGDVLTDMELTAMLRSHQARKAKVTIFLITAADPSLYGVVETDPDGRIRRFTEKPPPGQQSANTVNAGVYVMEREMLDLIPREHIVSIEREFFPDLLAQGVPFFGYHAHAYWIDIGTPEKYRQVHLDLLRGALSTPIAPPGVQHGDLWVGEGTVISPGAGVRGPSVIGRGVSLAPGSRVEPFSVLGDRCVVEAEGVVEGAVLWEEVRVGEGALLRECIVGSGCRIGAHAFIGPGVVLGESTVIPDHSHVRV
jgi:NDP-sugar pyrophosphorylase family protein